MERIPGATYTRELREETLKVVALLFSYDVFKA